MKTALKMTFMNLWKKYFGNAELPIVFWYTEEEGVADWAEKKKDWSCIICELAKVRNGESVMYDSKRIMCGGAKRYLGYTDKMRPGFEYFLSCGTMLIEGERYLHTPEQVKVFMKNLKSLPVEGKNIVFKRWDNIEETDDPQVVVFFAKPDVLSGLFTLANYDQEEPNGTFTPFGSGCGTMVYYPYLESLSERQRAVIGMFDPSARPCVPENAMTFAVPMKRFEKMIGYMEESFLITSTWTNLKKRIDTVNKR